MAMKDSGKGSSPNLPAPAALHDDYAIVKADALLGMLTEAGIEAPHSGGAFPKLEMEDGEGLLVRLDKRESMEEGEVGNDKPFFMNTFAILDPKKYIETRAKHPNGEKAFLGCKTLGDPTVLIEYLSEIPLGTVFMLSYGGKQGNKAGKRDFGLYQARTVYRPKPA